MMSSARPGPILCSAMSENRFTLVLRSAAIGESPDVIVGVWQWAQPTVVKRARPDVIEYAPPGVVDEGVGGARKRMKSLNFSMELVASTGLAASRSATSFATCA